MKHGRGRGVTNLSKGRGRTNPVNRERKMTVFMLCGSVTLGLRLSSVLQK